MAKIRPTNGEDKPGTSSSGGGGGLAPPPGPSRIPSSADLKKEALHAEVQIVDHKIAPEELAKKYETDLENVPLFIYYFYKFPLKGLTTEKAEELLKKFGPNALEAPKTIPEWLKMLKTQLSGFALLLWVGVILCMIAFFVGYFTTDRPSYDYVILNYLGNLAKIIKIHFNGIR